jgi:hypothetical protein
MIAPAWLAVHGCTHTDDTPEGIFHILKGWI